MILRSENTLTSKFGIQKYVLFYTIVSTKYLLSESFYCHHIHRFNHNISIIPAICPTLVCDKPPLWIKERIRSHQNLIKQYPFRLYYDFIIVGGGAAGCVLASRLSENGAVSVLLVEAGGAENITTDIPSAMPLLAGTQYDWSFYTEPQTDSFINTDPDRRARWPQGKGLGGSSIINGMVYLRGSAHDFDNWANKMTGGEHWSYAKVLPYFLRSERNLNPQYFTSIYHNSSGPLPNGPNAELNAHSMAGYTLAACHELGVNVVDLNAPNNVGANIMPQPIFQGSRVSASKAFLEPVIDQRPNLHVWANARVKKILFTADKKAYGVKFEHFGQTFIVGASKEVILSAGAINSPHLLLLSGVGPADQLQKYGIPLVSHIKGVGKNLHDHPYIFGPLLTFKSIEPPKDICSQYFVNQSGPLSHFDIVSLFANTETNPNRDWPDVQVCAFQLPDTMTQANNLLNATDQYSRAKYSTEISIALVVFLNRPKSRGFLELNSSDPLAHPKLQPNFLADPDDIKGLIGGLRWVYRIAKTNAFSSFGNHAFGGVVSGCESLYKFVNDILYPNLMIPADGYLECMARRMTVAAIHPVGTNKMGSATDPSAVVDPYLRVLGGVSRLRVIDSSIIPNIPSANTYAATLMIAERGAQFIKDYYGL